jgi:hypothetical protein
VGSAYKFVSVDCLSSIALHPYYKLAYIELAWGGTKEQEAKYSGLRKCCNVWQFWIICSVVLYSVEITLSITERK